MELANWLKENKKELCIRENLYAITLDEDNFDALIELFIRVSKL